MPENFEIAVRLGFFIGVLLLMSTWELAAPRRTLTVSKSPRWTSNLALVVINSVLLRLVVPVTAVAAALVVQARGWGLLSLVEWPWWLEVVVALIAFDLAIYLQHVLFHAVPVLWRLHMVHHADLDFDVTTGLRFHTFEIALSALYKLAVVVFLGPPAIAVIAFEVLLNATAMFSHSNIRMPNRLDRMLRWLIVTPDMHRVHHSVNPREANSNFGFNLSCWDYLLGTYLAQPAEGHERMTIGIDSVRDEQIADRLPKMLTMPFAKDRRSQ